MNYSQRIAILILLLSILSNFSISQNSDFLKPRQEELLNGLRVLIWSRSDTDRVTVKLRIHSGSAFDPKGKMGTMALLSSILFSEEGLKSLFEKDLGGKLEVTYNYDYIQINATAKSDEFLTILETIVPSLINPTIGKETTASVKTKQLVKIRNLHSNPSYLAERVAAKNLFGEFPYGRSKAGTEESLAKIDFADLILAKQRFLTSDNATIAVMGNVKSDFVYRAVRRFFGGWSKSYKKIPASFRLPGNPDTNRKIIEAIGDEKKEAHFAVEGFSRNDHDFFASKILEKTLQKRTEDLLSRDGNLIEASVKQTSHLLKGMFFLSCQSKASIDKDLVALLLKDPISQSEFEKAKSQTLSELAKLDRVELWFDIHTYNLKSIDDEKMKATSVSLGDVQKIANELKTKPIAQAVILFKEEKPVDFVNQDTEPKDPSRQADRFL